MVILWFSELDADQIKACNRKFIEMISKIRAF